ncbi:MAG: glycosyltransferase [Gemmatimonadaceae bacterium]
MSTLQHLFANLIGHRTIVWVNSFGHRAPQLTLYDLRRAAGKVRSMLAGYRVPADGKPGPTRIIEPRALPWHNIAAVRWLNTWSLLHDIRGALQDVAPGERPLLITGTPAAVGVVGSLDEVASLYFCIDDYAELPGVDRDVVAPVEQALLGKVDAVVATAARLVELKRPASGLAYQVPQGVNFDHFAEPRATPPDIAALPRPRIGFAGGVSSACDFELLAKIAAAYPHGSVVLVGPVQAGVQPPELPNVHLLGNKPYDALPAYVQSFDVGIIPYLINDWTLSVDPLKLLEYLAAGIPVVATPLPEVKKYAGAIAVADTASAFVAAIAAALPGSGRAECIDGRRAVARQHTWARRAARLMQIAEEVAAARAR